MVKTVAITEAIVSLNDAHSQFQLVRTSDPRFFTEWFEDLPELTESEKDSLIRLKNRYFYYAADGAITEGTINIIMVSPLLELVGLCDPPFKIRGEKSVKVQLEDEDKLLQGFIDALVVQEQLWVVVIEAKRYGFNVTLAIPQALAYMMASNPEKPVLGMATNGEDFYFIKLTQQGIRQYDLSDKFTLSKRGDSELYDVLRVMKRIASSLM